MDSLVRMQIASWVRFELGITGAALSLDPATTLRTLAIAIRESLTNGSAVR
jgi:hypothetical protein